MNRNKHRKVYDQRQFYETKIDELIEILSQNNPTLILSLDQIPNDKHEALQIDNKKRLYKAFEIIQNYVKQHGTTKYFEGYKGFGLSYEYYYIYASKFQKEYTRNNYNKAIIIFKDLLGYRNPYEQSAYKLLEGVFLNETKILEQAEKE